MPSASLLRTTAACGAIVVLAGSGTCAAATVRSATVRTVRAPAAVRYKACMVTDTGGIDDRSFNQLSWAAMRAAADDDHKMTVRYLQSTTEADY